ncbi:hypothetical protein Tco_1569429 [Tanacetum coccineum]
MNLKEPTYQVVLDALALTTCYPAFLITAEVPVIYMHQFWAIVDKHKALYRFKIDNKKFSVNVEVFRGILNICLRIPGQEFDEPPSEEEALSFIRELGHSREIKYITDVIVDHLHQPWRTFALIINKYLCGKVSGAEPSKLKKPKIKSDLAISSEEIPSKKKPTKAKKDVPSKKKSTSKPKSTKKKALVEANKGDRTDFELGVPDEQQRKTSDSDDDECNEDNSDEVTKDDDVKKEEKEEDDVRTPDSFEFNDDDEEYDELYKDVNVRSKFTEPKEVGKEDAKMTETTHESASQEKSYEQVIKDVHVTLTSSQKTEGSKQSFSVSSDFASKFLNLDNAPPVIDEVASMMNVKTSHEELSTQTPPNISVPVTAIPEISTVYVTIVTLIIQPFSSILQMTTTTPVPTTEPTTSLVSNLLDFV